MSQSMPRSNDPIRKAIGKLVLGLERRDRDQAERRRHHRFNFGMKVHLCQKLEDSNYQTICEVWALDLSIGGIGCLSEQDVPLMNVLYIDFQEVIGHHCLIPVRVKHSKIILGNIRQLHAEFFFCDESDGLSADAA